MVLIEILRIGLRKILISMLSYARNLSPPYHYHPRSNNISMQTPSSAPLEHQSSTLRLLVTAQLEMLASLQRQLCLGLATRAFQPQHHLFRCLGFLVKDGFGLSSVSGLFAVVAALSLGD